MWRIEGVLYFFCLGIKIQTAGGAYYQKDCICDISQVSSDFPDWGDAAVTYECRMYTPDANVTSIDGNERILSAVHLNKRVTLII